MQQCIYILLPMNKILHIKMMNRKYLTKYLVFALAILLLLGCSNQPNKNKINKDYAIKDIPVMVIRNTILHAALDSVIIFEKACSKNNSHSIIGFTVKNSEFWFTKESELSNYLSWASFKGCLRYKGYIFLTNDVDLYWFKMTDQHLHILYKQTKKIPPPPPPMDDNGTIIQIKGNNIIIKQKVQCE